MLIKHGLSVRPPVYTFACSHVCPPICLSILKDCFSDFTISRSRSWMSEMCENGQFQNLISSVGMPVIKRLLVIMIPVLKDNIFKRTDFLFLLIMWPSKLECYEESTGFYIRPTVKTVFINTHCCSSVLMLRPHRLEQPSFVRTADSFTSFRSQLKTYMFARHL